MSAILEEGIGFGGNNESSNPQLSKPVVQVSSETYPTPNPPTRTEKWTFAEVEKEMLESGKKHISDQVNTAIEKELQRRNSGIVSKNIASLLSECNRGNNHFTSSYVHTPENIKPRGFDETKKLVDNFREKVANYPKHMSYEGSMVLCVLLSMKKVASVNMQNIPSVDQTLIKSLLSKEVDVSNFDVKFDDNKDFILVFNPQDNKDLTLILFNTVAHPRPSDISQEGVNVVPVEDDGDVVKVGGKILVDKRTIRTILGQPSKDSVSNQVAEEPYKKHQPSVNRNAYEIRSDVLQMAIDWAKADARRNSGVNNGASDEELLALAKKFYTFVENRR